MSVSQETSTESPAACRSPHEQTLFLNDNVDPHSDDNNPTFIVTDPDSDIETDATPDAPRPRNSFIPDPPKPNSVVNEGPRRESSEQFHDKKSSSSSSNSGKIPGGLPKNRIPRAGATSIMVNVVNSQNVHFGKKTIIYGANCREKKFSQENEEEISPPEYEILMSSLRVVNDDHLDCVADNIGEKWKSLGMQLGLNKAAIYRLEQDYQDNHREKVYQLLLEWKQSIGGPNQAPLLSRLSGALWLIRERNALDGLVKLENDPRLKSL